MHLTMGSRNLLRSIGKFPWGTSKKARAKSRKLASSSSLQEPLPADFRKREHANSRISMPPALSSGYSLPSGHNALPSGHNAVDAGPLLIDLLDVKEEEVEECFHTLVDHNEVAWSYYKDLSVSLWHGNEMIGDGGVTEFIQLRTEKDL